MTHVALRTGARMPAVSLGCWKIDRAATKGVVLEALRAGYRGLDLACDYGNEREVGEAIREALAAGVCTREELFVTSKLWNTYHAKEHVEPACRKTLADLGLDYVDLYLIHFPIPLKYVPIESRYPPEWLSDAGVMEVVPVPVAETWSAMEQLVDQGLCKAIGVSNFSCSLVNELLASQPRVPPAVNQVENHPYLVQSKLCGHMRANDIAVTAFSPLGSSSYVSIGGDRGHGAGVLEDAAVKRIAETHGVTPAQVCLRWQVQRGHAVVPKSTDPARLRENLAAATCCELAEDEMAAVAALDRHLRYNDPGDFCRHMGPQWADTGYPIHD